MPPNDNDLTENSKENLDRKLDHAIEETFPTSHPVSVSITKGGAIDYDRQEATTSPAREGSGEEGQGSADNLLMQAKQTVSGVASAATKAAREAYDRGNQYAREAGERYPEAERYYRDGTQAVRQQASENPILTLLAGVAIGYALGWMLHSGRSNRDQRVPDYAKTRRGYSPHAPQPRA